MIEAELHDGTVLEFPDETDESVIQQTVKKMTLGGKSEPTPQSTLPIGPRAASAATSPTETARPGENYPDIVKAEASEGWGEFTRPIDPSDATVGGVRRAIG